jgi:hypothetical protein
MEDDLSTGAMVKMIEGARLVVLPTVASRINASGNGTYMNAMFMGKCVILSEGPEQSPAAGFRIRCDQSPDRFDVSEVEDPSAIFPLDCHLYSSSLPEMAAERKLFLGSFGFFIGRHTGTAHLTIRA